MSNVLSLKTGLKNQLTHEKYSEFQNMHKM